MRTNRSRCSCSLSLSTPDFHEKRWRHIYSSFHNSHHSLLWSGVVFFAVFEHKLYTKWCVQYARTTLRQKLYLVRTIVNASPPQSRGDAYQAKTSYIHYSPSSRVVIRIYTRIKVHTRVKTNADIYKLAAEKESILRCTSTRVSAMQECWLWKT